MENSECPKWMTDAVTRFLHSPLYSGPLLNFIDTNCITFENGEQNKLAYTTVCFVPSFPERISLLKFLLVIR
jgi:hypothetical protein